MRSIFNSLVSPSGYALGFMPVLVIASYAVPQHLSLALIGLFVWGVVCDLAYVFRRWASRSNKAI